MISIFKIDAVLVNMDEVFDISVFYNNARLSFPSKLLNHGYSSKIEVEVNGVKVFFELDEERSWRTLIGYDEIVGNKNISKDHRLQSHHLLMNQLNKELVKKSPNRFSNLKKYTPVPIPALDAFIAL